MPKQAKRTSAAMREVQADGGDEYQAGYGDEGQHTAAEHDVERALYGPVAQARAVPVLHGLHGLVAHTHLAAIHGLGYKRRPNWSI